MSGSSVSSLPFLLAALGSWQRVGGTFQLHPGDVGWFWRFGEAETSSAVRVWSVDDVPAAIGLLDGPTLLRLALDPRVARDGVLAERICGDLQGIATVEAPAGSAVRGILEARGWTAGEQWVPLERDLAEPVEDCGFEVRVVDAGALDDRVAVQRAAFDGSTFTPDRWRAMASGRAYMDARCLVGYDDSGAAVAMCTVWSAGDGRPGLIEPLGVHRDHRGRGYGKAITVAAASALRELGSASALVATPQANVAGVATYASAGFEARDPISDLVRP